jgi:hypothetical protein
MGGPLDEFTSDRRGRVFIPWRVLLSSLLEGGKTPEFDELREQLEAYLELPYAEVIGRSAGAR